VAQVRVVQCNILHGGWPYEIRGRQLFVKRPDRIQAAEDRFTKLSYPPDRPATGDPGSQFARQMAESVLPDVIGMQEVESGDVERLTGLLGPEWRNVAPLDGHAASCIFWNSVTVTPSGDREVVPIQNYFDPESHTTTLIRVLRQVFVHLESQKVFALVTGKSWYRGSQQDRKLRATNTRNLARKGALTAMAALDMSPPGSPAFLAMRPFVAKGTQPTCPAGIFKDRPLPNGRAAPYLRTDHIFYYSPPLGARQASGIIQCNTGPFFGSDHLYVWADITLP
jgi:hypothetical protein